MDAVNVNESPEVKLHFLDYWRVIRLRKSLILTVFLLCVITTVGVVYWLPPTYASKVTIEVEKDNPEAPLLENRLSYGSFDPYFLQTEFSIIKSSSILNTVISNLNLTAALAKQDGEEPWTVNDTYDRLSKKVAVEQTHSTSLIDISVKNTDPALAANIANAIADAYRQYRLDRWKSNRGSGVTSLKKTLAERKAALTNAEGELDKLRTALKIPDLGEGNPMANETLGGDTLKGLDIDRIEALTHYLEYSNILAHLENLQGDELKAALPTAYPYQLDSDLSMFSERLTLAKDKMTAAVQTLGTNNPDYQTAEKQLAEATRDYDAKVVGIMAGLRTRVTIEKTRLNLLQQEEKDAEEKNNELAAKYRPYYQKKLEAESMRHIADDLEATVAKEEGEFSQPLQSIVTVTDAARVEKHPVSPKIIVIVPLGVFVGLFVGMGLAFFIEYLDTSVKTIDDVERALQSPVLGVIPQNVGNILDDGPDSPHAEAYRVLRTNILFSRKNETWNTVSVLSGGAGEGKSTTLFNLATVFAQHGQRVLIVDSDLRRPSIHKLLHGSNNIGLTDYLLKQKTLEQVIQKSKLETLDFLPSGKLPNSSMSILASPQMKETIQELKHRYDYVFFDSPPLLGISDASVLASEMDMVLQVIQYRRYPQPMTLRAKQTILKVGGNLLGIVLNNINMSQDENYYYYSGYYEYSPQQKEGTVVHLSDAAKTGGVDIKQKY